MSSFASIITMSQDQFNALARIDKVAWSDESFNCLVTPVNDYFVSLIYSVVVEDSITVSFVAEMDVSTFSVTTDEITSLVPVIDNATIQTTLSTAESSFIEETVVCALPTMTASKEVTSSYSGYEFSESMSVSLPAINSGSKVTTASYVDYTIQTETANVSVPIISSGVKS